VKLEKNRPRRESSLIRGKEGEETVVEDKGRRGIRGAAQREAAINGIIISLPPATAAAAAQPSLSLPPLPSTLPFTSLYVRY